MRALTGEGFGFERFEGRSERYSTVDQGLFETILNSLVAGFFVVGRGGSIVFEEIERRGGRGEASDFGFDEAEASCFLLEVEKESKRVDCCLTQSRGRVRFQSAMILFVKVSEFPTTVTRKGKARSASS